MRSVQLRVRYKVAPHSLPFFIMMNGVIGSCFVALLSANEVVGIA